MHPYQPFAFLPVAVIAAWFAASHWSDSDLRRYHVPPVAQIEDPSVQLETRSRPVEKPDIRVRSFLPWVPPRPPAPAPGLILQSVMTGTGVHVATINNKIVKEGDHVEGYLVRRISADGVDLENGVKTRHLPMRPLHELQPPGRPGQSTTRKDAGNQHNKSDLPRELPVTLDR